MVHKEYKSCNMHLSRANEAVPFVTLAASRDIRVSRMTPYSPESWRAEASHSTEDEPE
jgi:hypothetical protein